MPIDIEGISRAGRAGALNAGGTDVADRLGDIGSEGINNYNIGTKTQSLWVKSNTSFSGCDINAIINLNGKLLQLGNLATLSYSIHREKQPVRTLGRIYPKAQVRGPLTIAGSLIFTVFDEHVLAQLRNVFDYEHNIPDLQKSLLPHQFPPFDIVVTFANEYGQQSFLRIYGVEIVDEGQTHSVNDMVSENMMQYVAKDIDLMISTKNGLSHANLSFGQAIFTSDRGAGKSEAVNLENRDRVRSDLAEFTKFLNLLEEEVNKWDHEEALQNPWSDAQYLNIYRIGNITTLTEAKVFLQECKINYENLLATADAYTNTNFGIDERRENPNDYSVRNQTTNNPYGK